MGGQMDEDDDELDLDLLERIALSTQSTPTAEMPRKKKETAASITAPAVDEPAASSASCAQSHSAMAVQGETSVVDGARCAHSPCLLLAPPYVRTAPHRTAPHRTARTSCIFQQRLTSCA
jgi:hypothetical protein